MKKYYALILTLLMTVQLLVGCNEKGISPTESLRINLNVEVYGDFSEVDKIGITETTAKTFQESRQAMLLGEVDKELDGEGVSFTKEEKEKLLANLLESLKKAKITYGKETIDGDKATVEIGMYPVDFTEAYKEYEAELQKRAESGEFKSFDEAMVIARQLVVEMYSKGKETQNSIPVTVEMKKNKGYWTISDNKAFEKELEKLFLLVGV